MARPPLISPWTPEQDEALLRMAAQGISALKIAAALKRNVTGVRVRARKLGSPIPGIREVRKKIAEAQPVRDKFALSPKW
jgi:hypothetical protein